MYDSYARLSRVPETGELEKIETQFDDNRGKIDYAMVDLELHIHRDSGLRVGCQQRDRPKYEMGTDRHRCHRGRGGRVHGHRVRSHLRRGTDRRPMPREFAAPYRLAITSGRLIVADQHSSDVVPYPKAIQLTVIIECRPGTWALRYDVTATAQGQIDHKNDASDTLTVASQQDCGVPR